MKKIKKGIVNINIILYIIVILLAVAIFTLIVLPKIDFNKINTFLNQNTESKIDTDTKIDTNQDNEVGNVLEENSGNLNTQEENPKVQEDISSDTRHTHETEEEELSHIKVNKKEGDGRILVTLVGSGNYPVKDSIFSLYDHEGYYICQFSTDEYGYGGVRGLPNGVYYFQQTKADGYTKHETMYKMTVDDENKTFYKTISIKQEKTTIAVIKLTDENEEPISGATFDLYTVKNGKEEVVKTVTTNEKGLAGVQNIRTDLKLYYIQTSTPEGYEINTQKWEFESTLDGNVEKFFVTNKKK